MPRGKPKGYPKTGGRAPGTPNKLTVEVREVMRRTFESLAPDVELWIRTAAQDDPAMGAKLALEYAEYFVPRLARHEVTGANGEALQVSVNINFAKGEKE